MELRGFVDGYFANFEEQGRRNFTMPAKNPDECIAQKNFVSDAHRKAWRLAELFYRLKGH